MSVSKQDWKQWHDTHWAGCQQAVIGATHSFEETLTAVNGGDADRFLSLTGGDSADGLHQTVNAAHHVVSPAASDLRGLALKGNQRRFANQDAIDISDEAVRALDELNFIISQVDTELVRGVQIEHDAVQADHNAMAGLAANVSGRLNTTVNMINSSLSSTDKAVAGLAGISKIGRF